MTAHALNVANRSFTFLGIFVAALDKAIAMARTVHKDSPTANDVRKLRAMIEAF
jgi:hypothetical protein